MQVTYEGAPSSVPEARHAVERALEDWGLHDLAWSGALLVTELAANALLHARTDFTVVLEALPGRAARIAVSDGSRALPRARRYGDEATTGRGLRLVADLSRGWGVEAAEHGKTVWAELAATASPAPGHHAVGDEADVEALLLAFPDLDDGPVTARAS